jgi:K+/H+ antiporter YhaU regulatory subunit KhtT
MAELLARPSAEPPLAQIATILPGFAGTATFTVRAGSEAVGRSLAELDLRARTGATVLAILRGGEGLATPSPNDALQLDDVLVLAGSAEAITAVRSLLEPSLPT